MLKQIEIIASKVRELQADVLLLFDAAKTRKQRRAVEAAQRGLTKWYDERLERLKKCL